MANPTIVFNSGTGSDTAASGAPASLTAVTGTAAAHTNGSASTTITLTNTPDLSSVPTDGTAVLWLDTGSGRQYSKITGVNDGADTVTVEDSFNIASGSAVNYAIGGKRATWDHADSRTVFADAKVLWTIQTETDQTITSTAINISGGSSTQNFYIAGDSTSTKRVINTTANAAIFDITPSDIRVHFSNLKLTCSNGTKTNAFGILHSGLTVISTCVNCTFGDATNTLFAGCKTFASHYKLYDCEIQYCTSTALQMQNTNSTWQLYGCYIHDNSGLAINDDSQHSFICKNCIIENNSGDAITCTQQKSYRGGFIIEGNVIDGNAGDGIDISSSAADWSEIVCINNNITNNGGYGIRGISSADDYKSFVDYNNLYNNTAGARLNITAGSNDIAVDPSYTNRGGADFSAGTSIKAKGFPDVDRYVGANASATVNYVDIGVQRAEPAAGGPVGTSLRGGFVN